MPAARATVPLKQGAQGPHEPRGGARAEERSGVVGAARKGRYDHRGHVGCHNRGVSGRSCGKRKSPGSGGPTKPANPPPRKGKRGRRCRRSGPPSVPRPTPNRTAGHGEERSGTAPRRLPEGTKSRRSTRVPHAEGKTCRLLSPGSGKVGGGQPGYRSGEPGGGRGGVRAHRKPRQAVCRLQHGQENMR